MNRIAQLSNSGSINFTPLFYHLGLGKRKVEEDFYLYPNPTTDYFTLEYSINKDEYSALKMEIFDASGRKVKIQQLNTNANTLLINVSELSKGVYTISFIADGNILSVEKLTIVK